MKYQAYPEYKDSCVEWVGEIPVGWDTGRFKYRVSLNTDKANSKTNSVALENIGSWTGEFIPSDSVFQGEGVVFQPGDLLFGKLRPYLAKVYLANTGGEAVGDFHVFRPKNIVARYLQYLMLTEEYISIVDGSTYGAKMPRASWEFMSDMGIPCPSLDEQQTIANFLDHETAKIDTLIAKQQQLVRLLKEKRQAVISHAVTKGLNPNAPMKNSGVEWLGEVPEHWEIGRVKNLASLISKGTTPTTIGGEFLDEGVQFLKAENIGKQFYVSEDPKFYISAEVDEQLSRSRLQAKDVLVIIAGATTGLCSVLPEKILPANTNQAVSFIRPQNKAYTEFIAHWLEIPFTQSSIWQGAVRAAQPNLSMEDLGNISIPIPPEEEVTKIVSGLDTKQSKFRRLSDLAENKIKLLQERRAALISAAVTGKIDVRNWKPEPAAAKQGLAHEK